MRQQWLSLVATLLVATSTLPARAEPDKKECVAANSAAQDLRSAGKLAAARAKLAICVSASCPGPVREDCAERLHEIEKVTPSVAFAVKDREGNDLADVDVMIDGQFFAKRLDGVPVNVDPGEHKFTFTASGFDVVSKVLVIQEGEKGRRERVTLLPARHVEQASRGGANVPVIVSFAVAGAGLVVGIISTVAWATTPCALDCPTVSVQRANQEALDGFTAGMVIGYVMAALGAGIGTALLVTAPKGSARVEPSIRIGVGSIGGTF